MSDLKEPFTCYICEGKIMTAVEFMEGKPRHYDQANCIVELIRQRGSLREYIGQLQNTIISRLSNEERDMK